MHISFITVVFLTTMISRSFSELSSRDAFEGKCIEPTPKVPPGVNYLWVLAPGTTMFLPMGSQHMYRSYAEYLIGRPPTDEKELLQMNLKIAYLGPFVTNSGFGQSFSQWCIPFDNRRPNIADMKCVSTFGTTRSNTTLINFTHDTLVWTDNSSAMVFVRCVRGERDFKVLSPFRTLSEQVRLKVLRKVKELGFLEKSILYLPYLT